MAFEMLELHTPYRDFAYCAFGVGIWVANYPQMLLSRFLKILLCLTLWTPLVEARAKTKARTKAKTRATTKTPKTTQLDPRFAKWAAVKKPKPEPTAIYGGYARGCITGAAQLPSNSTDYMIVNLNDRRIYGHPSLVEFLKDLSHYLRSQGVPPILIEDMSGPRGGPVLKGHASHQNGLDVDISFSLPTKPLTLAERAERPEVSFVKDRQTLAPNWGNAQTLLVVTAVRSAQVDRVFVAPAIKKAMCEKFPNEPWLYKLRAWWGHEDHLHVRLKCPVDQPNCVPQHLSPDDIQCGPSLETWMKRVRPAPAKATEPAPIETVEKVTPSPLRFKPFPTLPPQCASVVVD